MKRASLLAKYEDYLLFRNYGKQTIKTYVKVVDKFFQYTITNPSVDSSVTDYAKSYLTYLFSKGQTWSSVNVSYSALRLLFIHVLHLRWDYELIPRPRGRKSLPSVLSGRQVETIINSISNIKHKTIILFLYATGVRISELIHIDLAHLLLDRAQLKIVNGKGGKDRIIDLPPTIIPFLKLYLLCYNPHTTLFEGQPKQYRYSSSSINKIIKKIANQTQIPFPLSAHSFRYAYATHHLENGTNLVTLQYQMGHSDPTTTIKYVKLCKPSLKHINHPIERLRLMFPNKTT